MNSYKEINELADDLFNEGDTESLRITGQGERDSRKLCRDVSARKHSGTLVIR